MNADPTRWAELYSRRSLLDAPREFAGISQSVCMKAYLSAVLHHTPRGGRTLEVGVGSGLGA